jgi:acyl-CoA synthetase (AMP-forming)/AMP-acid ligase II
VARGVAALERVLGALAEHGRRRHVAARLAEDAIVEQNARHRLAARRGVDHLLEPLVHHVRELDTGTSATPIELIRALKHRFPWTRTRVYYGSTEAGSATTLPDADVLQKPGSVGLASPGVELRLGEAGEICVRSPFLMDGYFDDPEATAEALRDGWYHTGDLGVLDAEGYLSIVGRRKDVIRTGGESVTPAEVEAALVGAPGVAELAVVGIPDAQWGEVVCAVVVPAPDAVLTLDALRAHCEGQRAGFKRPRRLELVNARRVRPPPGRYSARS